MKRCNCEHWETCPICYPQGFDEHGVRKTVEIPPTREELQGQVEKLTGLVVMRFDHDVPPQFSQGYSEHEMVEPVTAEHCKWFVGEIVALREQVEKLTEECIVLRASNRSKLDTIAGMEQQLAALAEQNEKLKEAINLIYSWANNWDSEFMNDPDWLEQDYPFIQSTISLPDLATPVLNRIRAEGMRVAAEYCTKNTLASAHSLAVRLRDQAAELEKTNG